MMVCKRWTFAIGIMLALLPSVCSAWGTLTSQLPMTAEEEAKLRNLIYWYGVNSSQSDAEVVPRRGPHPTHQFIVRQAYLLLKKDPAYEGSPWKLPALESVLAWDGLVRKVEEPARPRKARVLGGMWERKEGGTGVAELLAPPKVGVGGPSADAEITADGNWNAEYNASFHYWNPWLKCGSAPTAAASCYHNLLKAMLKGGDENAKAKAASHMSHFIADAICAKHADMIPLDEDMLFELTHLAVNWFREHEGQPTMELRTWFASDDVTDAVNLIVKASGVPLTHPWWQRVNAHIADMRVLKSNTSYHRRTPDILDPSLRASVASLLAALHERRNRHPEKDLARFYNFFDPFYYNGQLAMQYDGSWDWNPLSFAEFGLATPAGEHVMYESNPALAEYVGRNLNHMILGSKLDKIYEALPESGDYGSPDTRKRTAAYSKAMAEFVRNAALIQHGARPSNALSFDQNGFEDSLERSVRYVFSALRSCITAIRCEATYAYFPEEKKFRIYCDLGNAADEELRVKTIRILITREGKFHSRPGWVKSVSCGVQRGVRKRVIVEVPQEGITEKDPPFHVDVFGEYQKTPDLCFWRGEVSQRPPRIMHGMSLPAFDRVEGALDLAICFDVTGSMSSSINSVRDNAIGILTKLKARLGDLRVALVSFRDIEADKEDAFAVTRFSPNVKGVIAKMKGWRATGGGDTDEDQLQAIKLAIDMWADNPSDPRKPTKIVVVITDAPPHDPDVHGNTQASIADYAESVDPAHIYPIVVGGSATAQAKAAELAKLTGGEVLTAKSGDEVASVLATAVEKAIAAHGTTAGGQIPPWMLFYGGLIAVVGGAVWFWRDVRKRPRA